MGKINEFFDKVESTVDSFCETHKDQIDNVEAKINKGADKVGDALDQCYGYIKNKVNEKSAEARDTKTTQTGDANTTQSDSTK